MNFFRRFLQKIVGFHTIFQAVRTQENDRQLSATLQTYRNRSMEDAKFDVESKNGGENSVTLLVGKLSSKNRFFEWGSFF